MKAVEWWKPKEEKKKRKPYQWGVKAYLTSFEVGEERVYDEKYRLHSFRCIASRLNRDYGVKFSFRLEDGVRVVRRLK